MELASNAAVSRIPGVCPHEYGIDLLDDDGTIESLRLADTPIHRVMLAISREIPDSHRFFSFMWRYRGLMQLIESGYLNPWRIEDPYASGGEQLHPAVLDAARKVTLDFNGNFPLKSFEAAITDSIKEDLSIY